MKNRAKSRRRRDEGETERMAALDGRVVAVAGGTGDIGRAICRRFVRQGARVWALDVREPQEPVAGAEFLHMDVTDPAAVRRVAELVAETAGRVDVLVNAAGIVENVPVADMEVDTFDRVIGVNLRGVFLTCQAFGRIMLSQGEGRIVNIASMSGTAVVNSPQCQAAYNTSKAAVAALTRSIAVEWAARGVRVNALSPGYVDTDLLALKRDQHASWQERTPLGRFATVDEVAGAVAYLAGDEAGFFQGADVLMDGGYTLW
jgi:NAD(P)-dependent dehydrogenase (short-subunit alcohol dehydrogenase family)